MFMYVVINNRMTTIDAVIRCSHKICSFHEDEFDIL